ncbi:SDR family oxidoreductase [Polyangium aurulentum]|uniref:SDR family oxidoreductase n=1 Tax=Polyangium aurulentum TaxID=2567896 RepID=UPI00146DF256|nr:SDR family oxidoreductase [Polyangium aurulentum]UQA56496.1 SDR family oxidoreductase [Polyangium aurulentum]
MAGKILITGATGATGTEVVKALAARGADVVVGVRSPEKAKALEGPTVRPVELDHARPETYERAFEGAERVFLLTPFSGDSVEIGKRMIDSAKAAGARHIVKLSALGAENEPGIQLGRWHREVEKYLEASGVAWTHLRPNSFMQNFIHYFGGSIKPEGKIYLPFGQGKVSWIDTRDIGEVAAAILAGDAAAHAGKAYDLTGPAAIGVDEVAAAIGRALGKEVTYVDIPEKVALEGLLSYGAPEWMANAMMELHAMNKAGHAAVVNDLVEKIGGKKPFDIDRFARDNVQAWS